MALDTLHRSSLPPRAPTAKSAGFTIDASYKEAVLSCTGSWTMALTAAATLASGFAFWASNDGTGIITIDPNSTELINGKTVEYLFPGESALFWTDGTSWKTTGLNWQGWRPVEVNSVLTNVAAWARTGLSMASALMLKGFVIPATNATQVGLRTDANGGASYDAGASDYSYQEHGATATTNIAGSGNASRMFFGGNISNSTTTGGVEFEALLENFNKVRQCNALIRAGHLDGTGGVNDVVDFLFCKRLDTTARDAVQIACASGNIASGRVSLWCLVG